MFFKSIQSREAVAAPLSATLPPSSGFYAGTQLACGAAWVAVEDLAVDDLVLTTDHGQQVVTNLETVQIQGSSGRTTKADWPLHVPQGVLGNAHPMVLASDMHVVISDSAALALFGEEHVALKAEDLIGHRGIARARLSKPLTKISITFSHGVCVMGEGMCFDIPNAQGVYQHRTLDAREARSLLWHLGSVRQTRKARKIASGWI